MNFYNRILKDNNGSSLVVVLIVILILTTLGTVSLAMSLNNIKMAGRYRDSSDEYYSLEEATQEALIYIDNQLEEAQNSALEYMRNEKYNQNKNLNELKNGYNQKFFYNAWKKQVFDTSQQRVVDMQGKTKTITNTDKYNEQMERFFQPAFNRLYYNYVLKNIEKLEDNIEDDVEPFERRAFTCEVQVEKNKAYDRVTGTSKWDDFEKEENDLIIKLDISNSSGKKLSAAVKIKPPISESVTNVQSVAVQGNPIWTNAITAKGRVRFEDVTSNIFGDIFASDKDGSGKGITIDNSNVHIRGNVYSKGDFEVVNGNSNVTISKYNGNVKVGYKSGMYDKDAFGNKNEVFFYRYDDTVVPAIIHINRYTDGKKIRDLESLTFMPLVYRDIDGGNVYCNNLIIKNQAENASISIDNSIWTKDDMINDSKGGSSIRVKGAYIGMRPPGKGSEGGSSVINNIYSDQNMNEIRLDGKFMVPGKKVLTDVNGKKYETLESISANVWTNDDFLKPYMSKDGISGEDYTFKINGVDKIFNLVTDNYEKLENYREYIKNQENSSVDRNSLPDMVSNIVSQINRPEGYISGAAILKRNGSYVCYGSYDDWYYPNSNLRRVNISKNEIRRTSTNMFSAKTFMENSMFENVFKSKTEYLGMYDIDINNMIDKSALFKDDGSVASESESGIMYLNATSNTLKVNGTYKGIVYVEGNLEIKGNGNFKGTIICTGNVTVSGNVTLHYDEDVIADILNKHEIAKRFFMPGAIGDAVFHEKRNSTNVRVRTIKDSERYKLAEWRQN